MKKPYDPNVKSNPIRLGLLGIFAILLFLIGAVSSIFSVIELFHGRVNAFRYDETQGGLKIETPLWPSSGKGFWVGLVLMATGLVGIVSYRKRTRSSIFGFTALAVVSTILSVYMLVTCIMPLQYYDQPSIDNQKETLQSNQLILNGLLLVTGAIGFVFGLLASIFGFMYGDCCKDQRSLEIVNHESSTLVFRTSIPIQYSTRNRINGGYPFQSEYVQTSL